MADKPIVATFAALTNSKAAIRSNNTPYFAVQEHFFYSLMKPYLSAVAVDEGWYLKRYPDIQTAISSGSVASGAEHYRRFGYFEHRMPHPIEVDEDFYLTSYPDVKAGVAGGHFKSGQWHFDALGFKEGRLPYANFALRTS